MHRWSGKIVFTAMIWGLCSLAPAQESSYILRREIFKVPLSSIRMSPDTSLLLAGFSDGSFRTLDPGTFQVKLEIPEAHYKAVNAMDMPPKMDFILSAGNNSIKLWDRNGEFLSALNGHATTIWTASISRDGKLALSSAMNKTFLLWDLSENKLQEHVRGHEDMCMAVNFSPDARLIASGGKDRTIKIWDVASRSVISTMHGPTGDIYDVSFSPDGRLLAAASEDRSVRIYEVASESLLHVLKGHSEMVMEAAFSPDGNFLISASADGSVILWDLATGEQIHQFTDHEGAVTDLVYHPDGRSFYSISTAGELTRWSIHPELFVLKYKEEAYLEELSSDPVFEARRKGESKKDYEARQAEASLRKEEIIARYYEQYLEERGP